MFNKTCLKKKKFKENAYLWTSSRGQVQQVKKKKKKIQRKCVPLDKFAWTSTVLDSRRGRDRLLDANNSIMETDGEGKFVSFKVVLGGKSLFKMNRGPAGLDFLVCRFYWSTGASCETHHGGFRGVSPRRNP